MADWASRLAHEESQVSAAQTTMAVFKSPLGIAAVVGLLTLVLLVVYAPPAVQQPRSDPLAAPTICWPRAMALAAIAGAVTYFAPAFFPREEP
jgi:hypothetical protein